MLGFVRRQDAGVLSLIAADLMSSSDDFNVALHVLAVIFLSRSLLHRRFNVDHDIPIVDLLGFWNIVVHHRNKLFIPFNRCDIRPVQYSVVVHTLVWEFRYRRSHPILGPDLDGWEANPIQGSRV